MEQLWPKTGNPLAIFFLPILLILCLPNVSKISIMAQENIKYLHNTKLVLVSVSWENIVSAHGAAKELIGGSLGMFLFLSILII